MKSMIDQAFRRYGMTVTVEHGAETGETHGFVQPVPAASSWACPTPNEARASREMDSITINSLFHGLFQDSKIPLRR